MAPDASPRKARRAVVALAAVAALPLALGACGSSSHTASGGSGSAATKPVSSIHVTIQNFAFHPANFTVTPGAKVTVTNKDSVAHTLTDQADQHLFNTGDVGPNQTKTFTAPTKAGKYGYICEIHQYMSGTLTVS